MANRAVEIGPAIALGLIIAALVLGSAAMVALSADDWVLNPSDWAAVRFTVVQAALSAGLSAVLAIPLARALHRRRFLGRAGLIRLLAAPFVLPVVVAVLGLLAVFGKAGPVNMALTNAGLPPLSIFGLHGVVLAHVFLNLPLATRMILHGWQAIPAERFRLAASLGMPHPALFWHLEWPMLRAILPGIAAMIFLICLTSFAIALTLGGGPKFSTVELAIYQALRFEFDLGRAALLASLQFGLGAAVTLGSLQLTLPSAFGAGLESVRFQVSVGGWRRGADYGVISASALFLMAPLIAVVAAGLPGLMQLPAAVWPAAARSVGIAVLSAVMATVAALTLAQAAARHPSGWFDLAAMLPLSASSLVLGTGLFLAVRPFASPESITVPITILVNTTLTVPFLFRLLLPEARQLRADYEQLSRSLGLTGLSRLRLVTLPRLAGPLGFGAGLAAALSMGDLGVIALFAGDQGATLPLIVQRLMGAYRMEAAAAVSLILVVLSYALFWIFDRLGHQYADA